MTTMRRPLIFCEGTRVRRQFESAPGVVEVWFGTVCQEDPQHDVDIGVQWDHGPRYLTHADTLEPIGDQQP